MLSKLKLQRGRKDTKFSSEKLLELQLDGGFCICLVVVAEMKSAMKFFFLLRK